MRDFNDIRIPGANMSNAKSDYVFYNRANLSDCNFSKARLSLSHFVGTNFKNADLTQAVMICSLNLQ